MTDEMLLTLLILGAVVAFAVGIWIGLGYPGLYSKYESTGRAPRHSPFEWLFGRFRR